MDKLVKKDKFLSKFLKLSSNKGWNMLVFEETQKKLKYNSSLVEELFPRKLDDLILFFNYVTNDKLSRTYKKKRFNKKSIRVSVLNAVKIRFELLNTNKDSIKKSLFFLSNPSKQILSGKLIYKTVDYVWKLIGDKSTDYNFYTKRIILASIYSAAIMIWINDKSDNLDKTFNFLDKSIMNMNIISVLKEKFSKFL